MRQKYFMKLRKTLASFLILAFATLAFYACTKETSSGTDKARMQVFLTDDPGDYDAVFIDVQDVRINYSNDTANGWQSLGSVTTGPIDLLTLINDNDTLLADAEINTGRVQQIRLILGNNNYVMVDGQRHDLTTPSAQQSGLKINIHQDVNEGVLYKLLLDFDVARSVHQTGNGRYMLKPVIRATMEAQGGSIRGFVTPDSIVTSVFAIQGTDTVAGTLTSSGAYSLRGLTAGSYNLSFVPSDTPTHQITTRTGIVVNTGQVTTVDTVHLQ